MELALNSVMVKPRVADLSSPSFRQATWLGLERDPNALARLAWEFLRRNPAYRADYARVMAGEDPSIAEHWGLAALVDPDQDEVDAATLWRSPGADDGEP